MVTEKHLRSARATRQSPEYSHEIASLSLVARNDKGKLNKIYRLMFNAFGPQHWWPGDTPLEIVVGAILTQNTAWVNVEKAITNLKRANFICNKVRVEGPATTTLAGRRGSRVEGWENKGGVILNPSAVILSEAPYKAKLLRGEVKNPVVSSGSLPCRQAGFARRRTQDDSRVYLKKLIKISPSKLAKLIRPAGYFNIKAKRLKNFVRWVVGRYGSLEKMFQTPTQKLRRELLSVNGIGPETADSILLYGGNKPVFVIDAYTKRILTRHKLAREDDDYHDIQSLFAKNLKKSIPLYNEYHALFVKTGKDLCKKKKPLCQKCPLGGV